MDDPGVVERYAAAALDPATLHELRHPDYVCRWPQSRELVRGRERMAALERSDPGDALHVDGVRRLDGQDDLWTLETVVTDAAGSRWWWVSILELRDGRVAIETAYRCEAFEAPAWRAPHVEAFDGSTPPAPLGARPDGSAAAAVRLGEAYGAAAKAQDYDRLGTLRAAGWTCEWPQSGERIRGHAADVAIHSAYPGYPNLQLTRVATSPEGWELSPLLVPIRVHGAGPMAVGEGINDYPQGDRWFVVQLLEVGGGRVTRETGYFGRAIEPPSWRAAFVERFDPLAAS
ncbi:MAG TPA: nuclear transport factor 2 family protein [Candidatus Sulfotelmatobacter sp.]|nr:nuclear transport factor 2 family protein [Candidatus Sulfotelmatobacter sp.]